MPCTNHWRHRIQRQNNDRDIDSTSAEGMARRHDSRWQHAYFCIGTIALIGPDTPVILELSSFVLEGLGAAGLSPAIAAITNIYPDHLDRYGTMEAYIAAKAEIGRHQQDQNTIVLTDTDEALVRLAPAMPGQLVWTGVRAPRVPTQGSVWWDTDVLYAALQEATVAIAQRTDVQLAGTHNLANIATAVALALRAGMPHTAIAPALRAFTGVEHRQELVATHDGHTFVNDTAATMPDAAVAALTSLPQPIIWIAGGADKKLSFESLAATAATHAQQIVLLQGTATALLHDALVRHGAGGRIIGTFDSFEAGIRAAHALPLRPATIALSPGCASFGMFRNEFHRGEEFRRIVTQIIAEAGQ